MNQHWGLSNSTQEQPSAQPLQIKEELIENNGNVNEPQTTTDLSNMSVAKTEPSPGGTVSAAADSSDNQPPTPTPNDVGGYNNQMYQTGPPLPPPSAYQPTYTPMNTYDQYYHHQSPSAVDGSYNQQMIGQQQQQQQHQQLPYGAGGGNGSGDFKPTARFHPYMTNTSNSNTGSSISTSGSISPRVVSSSSPAVGPINNNSTPSGPPTDMSGASDQVTIKEEGNSNSQFSFAPYAIKQEDQGPQSDILDLDSQKMVYPQDPNDPTLPSMHSMHPMHRPIMSQWGQTQEMHYQMPPTTPNDPHMGAGKPTAFFSPTHQPPPTSNMVIPQKAVSSSPSEYPSTTTTQEGFAQQRFEPPTSSLPNNSTKTSAATWKSNEARRPKTYNCTACNKWFTSSGHLKRHYNTTLHKNAVKSSNAPDPATLPISAHHHPERDPNSKHNRNRNHRPPAPPPEPPTSPEYAYTGQSPNYQQQQQQQQQHGYQNFQQQNLNGHPNGLAGPSVHHNNASQQRGLLNISNNSEVMPAAGEQPMDQEVSTTINLHQHSPHSTELEDSNSSHNSSHNSSRSSNHSNSSLEHHHQQLQQAHQHQQLHQQQQQQQSQVHIISHHIFHTTPQQPQSPEHQDTIHTHNIMDQQQYIINPLGINPTTTTTQTHNGQEVPESVSEAITTTTTTNTLQQHNITTTVAPTVAMQSYQHLQLPVEPQATYPTHIIGNGNEILDNYDTCSSSSSPHSYIHDNTQHLHTQTQHDPTLNPNSIYFSHNSDENLLQLDNAATSPEHNQTTTTYVLAQMSSPSDQSDHQMITHQQQQHHHNLFQPIEMIDAQYADESQMTNTIISNQHTHITNTDGHILEIIPSTTPPMLHHQSMEAHHHQQLLQQQQQQQQQIINYNNSTHQHTTTTTANYINQFNQQQQQQQEQLLEFQRMSGGVPIYREKLVQPYSPAVPESNDDLMMRLSSYINRRSPQEADMAPAHYTNMMGMDQQIDYTQTSYIATPLTSATITSTSAATITTGHQHQEAGGEETTTEPTAQKKRRAPKRKRDPSSSPTNDTSTENMKIVCLECNKEFAKICYLTQHNKTFHNGEQPFRCPKCGKRFPNAETYEAHLERHVAADKPFKCDVCPKQFHHKTDLRRHKEAIHTGLKAHVCDLCNKSFCRKDHLRKHIETHSRVKPVRREKKPSAARNNNNFLVANNNHIVAATTTTTKKKNVAKVATATVTLDAKSLIKEELIIEDYEDYVCDDEEIMA